jgi:hypothetical protein
MREFDASFEIGDTVQRSNHGKTWTVEEIARLAYLLDINCPMPQMCDMLQRSATSVRMKLESNCLIVAGGGSGPKFNILEDNLRDLRNKSGHKVTFSDHGAVTGRMSSSRPSMQEFPKADHNWPDEHTATAERFIASAINPPIQEDLSMSNKITIEVKTFVNGVEGSTLTDAAIFNKIAAIEVEIEKLEAIKRKPKKLVALIAEMQADVEKLADYVDKR